MIFESLWPLFFLAAVPLIIILYLLKPRGLDHLMSSNLLWQNLLKNEQSRTFFEKFVHDLLMYLQILIIGLLVVALMSPFIRQEGHGGAREILLFDTSGSMQHVGASGKSRLEQAVEEACSYVRDAGGTQFSIVTVDMTGVNLLAVDIADTDSLVRTLRGLECSDSLGSLAAAQGILDTLAGSGEEDGAKLLVFTDASGAAEFEELHGTNGKELHVAGESVSNVANEYMVFAKRQDELYDVMVSVTNYSDETASMDVSLYDEGEKLIALSSMHLLPSESKICLFEEVDWNGQNMSSKLDGISFSGGSRDSLAGDNVSRAVRSRGNLIEGLLVGSGNTFIEKAYLAVTGTDLAKAETMDAAVEESDCNVVIYDKGQVPGDNACNRLVFGADGGEVAEELENVVLDMTDSALSSGLSGFSIGVNHANCFVLPEGAESFLEYKGKCVGYYGEKDGRKEVVVGFDIRESDFPLRAEFPVFLANAMIYLSDTSWLASNVYYAGEEIALQPWAEPEQGTFESRPAKAGLYQVGNEEYQEPYVVRFRTATESDGRGEAESISVGTDGVRLQKVKRTLRNLFLILALVLLVAEWLLYVYRLRYRGKFYLAVRAMVVLCVLLALCGIRIRLGSSRMATVFLVDLSDSNEGHLEEIGAYLRKAVDGMPKGNAYGIVTFGKNTLVEQFLTSEKYYGGLMTLPEKSATNFEEAVSRALTMIPGDGGGRIVALTDGKQTRGDISHMARALPAGKTEFLTLLYEDEVTPDAYIDNVTLPAYLHPGDKYSVNVAVESNYDTDAVILLYNGSVQTAAREVHLNRGSNRFLFSEQVGADKDGGAMENLRVQVQAPGDTCPENDFYSAYSVVEAAPRILVISGMNTNTSAFAAALTAAGCDYSMVSPLNAPDGINAMLDYKSIVLVNTYIDDLPQGFLDNLDTYVKDYGCGFVCCGGEDSFALGGYRDTVIEDVLPVDMELRSVDEVPTMAMIMVIDHSGSMSGSVGDSGASNLDIAIRAANVAVDNLRSSDYVGVLTFDDQYEWQVEICQADDREAIKEKIKRVKDGGGTTIKPALKEACEAVSKCEVSTRHVVLLTDGMGETSDYRDVIQDYNKNGVTMSTVAVGDGSDTQLLERLAQSCGGRYYYSDISSDIPRIFAQEVFLGGDSYIQNGEFALSVRRGHELTANIFEEGWPPIYGYISATPKTASSPVIVSEEKGDPILTVWQYGLGRTAAWNSDVTGEWSGAFAGQSDYAQLWKRIVDYSTGNVNMGEDRIDVVTAGEATNLVYQTEEYSGGTQILATVIDPAGETSEVKLHATAPGRYETEVPTAQTGLYHFNIRRTEEGEIQNYLTTAAAVQFSDEYKFNVSTTPYLQFVEQYGRVITEKDNIWTRLDTSAREKRSLTNFLIALAICLFLADVAMRRFQYVPKWRLRIAGRGKKGEQNVQNAAGASAQEGSGTKALGEGSAAVGAEQSDETAQKAAEEQPERKNTKNKPPAPDGKKKSQKSKAAKESERETLDTSQLLKKKGDRNL